MSEPTIRMDATEKQECPVSNDSKSEVPKEQVILRFRRDSDRSDYASSDDESVEGSPADDLLENDPTEQELKETTWRVNFRKRTRVPFDTIIVDSTSPVEENFPNAISLLKKDDGGHTVAKFFQFRHELKDSTYKNKYILRLDGHKMTFSERDDSILIRSDGDATVHMGIANNNLFRNRNMAMEELRNMLNLNLSVWKSLFISNRDEQMGKIDLSKFVNTVTAQNLTIVMDSFENIVEIVKIHNPVLNKFTLICSDKFEGLIELEQVQNATNLKLDGPSEITDAQLLTVKATNFEITSDKITCRGLNEFVKTLLSSDISDNFYAHIACDHGTWEPQEFLKGLNYVEYKDESEYVLKNGRIGVNMFEATLVSIPTSDEKDRLAVVMNKYYFECFKESKKPRLLSHDIIDLD